MTVFEAITQSPEALAKQINLMFYCDPQKELAFAEWLKTNCDGEDWKPWREDLATGWDIDRLRQLMDADQDGRVVVLPCNEGDYVEWDNGTGLGTMLKRVRGFMFVEGIKRIVLEDCEPIMGMKAIVRYISSKDAVAALKDRIGGGAGVG